MRYAQGGGLTPQEQQARERIRLEAGARFARGDTTAAIATDLRVGTRQVEKWRRTWRAGCLDALRSKGPLSADQWQRLEAELGRGPVAHGWDDGRGWTLLRVKTLIGRLFHLGYTVPGVGELLHRHGWSVQQPVRRALERDTAAVQVWKDEVWPQVQGSRRTWAPGSVSRTRRGRG
ncbi:winged helix-turn-helix domain-containing protein [Candidatus Protofrankia californiensis]|uniref:winged helix-turn-helix domain-containing protein n=1 Tax=Candidatus Protofrankia californiensis TaxID=1839754 RepID=UPI00104103F8|nr:winged helix-turn-helix domain-containing protein [Candidatus Protofrankia californiensis]